MARGVHVAKRGGKDQISPIQRHLRHHPLRVRPLGHVFHIDGFDLVAEGGLNGLAALIVFIGPAAIAHGANIDKADLGFGMPVRIGGGAQPQRQRGTGQKCR